MDRVRSGRASRFLPWGRSLPHATSPATLWLGCTSGMLMPTLSYRHGLSLPIIDVTLQFDPHGGAVHPSGAATSATVKALIDTGATHVVANPHVLAPLGFVPCGSFNQSTVGGATRVVAAYAGQIVFGGPSLSHTVTGLAILADSLPAGYDVLIGWDAMQFLDWRFDRSGDFHISW